MRELSLWFVAATMFVAVVVAAFKMSWFVFLAALIVLQVCVFVAWRTMRT